MLPNEVFALECIARYAREGLVVNRRTIHNGRRAQFAHCPEPRPKGQKWRLSGDKGYWLTFNDHQKQGLLQSVDLGRRCYFIQDVKMYLDTKPPGYEELYEIYNKFNKLTEEQKKAISGENNSNYGRTGEKHPMFGKTGVLNPCSKGIIAIKPDGTELHFGSVREAARELQCNPSNLCIKYLKTGRSPRSGKFKNWQFFYAEQ
jgi:hypothetical protein